MFEYFITGIVIGIVVFVGLPMLFDWIDERWTEQSASPSGQMGTEGGVFEIDEMVTTVERYDVAIFPEENVQQDGANSKITCTSSAGRYTIDKEIDAVAADTDEIVFVNYETLLDVQQSKHFSGNSSNG